MKMHGIALGEQKHYKEEKQNGKLQGTGQIDVHVREPFLALGVVQEMKLKTNWTIKIDFYELATILVKSTR